MILYFVLIAWNPLINVVYEVRFVRLDIPFGKSSIHSVKPIGQAFGIGQEDALPHSKESIDFGLPDCPRVFVYAFHFFCFVGCGV